MSAMASQVTSLSSVCSIVSSGTDQRKHQSPAPLAMVDGGFPLYKGAVTRKIFPFYDVITIVRRTPIFASKLPLIQIMAFRLFRRKPLPEPVLAYLYFESWVHVSVKFVFHTRKKNEIYRLLNDFYLVLFVNLILRGSGIRLSERITYITGKIITLWIRFRTTVYVLLLCCSHCCKPRPWKQEQPLSLCLVRPFLW